MYGTWEWVQGVGRSLILEAKLEMRGVEGEVLIPTVSFVPGATPGTREWLREAEYSLHPEAKLRTRDFGSDALPTDSSKPVVSLGTQEWVRETGCQLVSYPTGVKSKPTLEPRGVVRATCGLNMVRLSLSSSNMVEVRKKPGRTLSRQGPLVKAASASSFKSALTDVSFKSH